MARIEKIECFSSFRQSMLEYFDSFKEEDRKRRKSTISHRIALSIGRNFPGLSVDIDYDGVDILVRDTSGKDVLAIFWSNTYLTEKEKEKAQNYHLTHSPMLTLAFSLLEEKDYLLIYRFEDNYLEYLHINKIDFSEMLLKRCLIRDEKKKKEEEQPSLFSKKHRKKKETPTS